MEQPGKTIAGGELEQEEEQLLMPGCLKICKKEGLGFVRTTRKQT